MVFEGCCGDGVCWDFWVLLLLVFFFDEDVVVIVCGDCDGLFVCGVYFYLVLVYVVVLL